MAAGLQQGGGNGNVRALALAHLCSGSQVALVEEGHWQWHWCCHQRLFFAQFALLSLAQAAWLALLDLRQGGALAMGHHWGHRWLRYSAANNGEGTAVLALLILHRD